MPSQAMVRIFGWGKLVRRSDRWGSGAGYDRRAVDTLKHAVLPA